MQGWIYPLFVNANTSPVFIQLVNPSSFIKWIEKDFLLLFALQICYVNEICHALHISVQYPLLQKAY